VEAIQAGGRSDETGEGELPMIGAPRDGRSIRPIDPPATPFAGRPQRVKRRAAVRVGNGLR